jgi:hypothetical protein
VARLLTTNVSGERDEMPLEENTGSISIDLEAKWVLSVAGV